MTALLLLALLIFGGNISDPALTLSGAAEPGAMRPVPERREQLVSVEWPSKSLSAASHPERSVGRRGAETAGSAAPLSAISDPAWAIKGSATWYDAPSMRDAAAGPALRSAIGPGWRGTWVTVCRGGCVTVKLTDWCLCSRGNRVIDLDDRAFARLAPLGRGVISVVVTGAATLPATDTAEPYHSVGFQVAV